MISHEQMLEIVTDEARTGEVSAEEARYAAGTEAGVCKCGEWMWTVYLAHGGNVVCECSGCGADGTAVIRSMLAQPHNAEVCQPEGAKNL